MQPSVRIGKPAYRAEPLAPSRGLGLACLLGLGLWSLAIGLFLLAPSVLYLLAGVLGSLLATTVFAPLVVRRSRPRPGAPLAVRSSLQR